MTTRIARAAARLIEYRLDQPVGGSGVSGADVIIVDIEDSDGAAGFGFSYVLGGDGALALKAAQAQLARFVTGRPMAPPQAGWKTIFGSFNRSGLGPNAIALAAIDTACWDLHARRLGVPLGVAMGGDGTRRAPVYGSGGFNTLQSAEQAAAVAQEYRARGFSAVKPRVAGRPKDARVIGAVRAAMGDDGEVMADANEKCDAVSALRLMNVARDHGVLFVEEPLPAQALAGYRRLRSASAVAIAAGEHIQEPAQLVALMADGVIGLAQPDLAMIGGLTPVLALATVAEALDVAVSPHFLPGLFIHVAAAAPSLRWLEEFPLLEPLFDGWPPIAADGTMQATAAIGHGLQLSERAHALSRDQ